MPTNSPRIIGLDGQTRDWDEVFGGYVAGCTQDARSGYVVRHTYFDRSQPHEDCAEYAAGDYASAIEAAHDIRVGSTTYNDGAVIDALYDVAGHGRVRVAG